MKVGTGILSHRLIQITMAAMSLVLLASIYRVSWAQAKPQIIIRYVDFKSGKPVAKLHVRITLWNGPPMAASIPKRSVVQEVSAVTNSAGEITVSLPSTVPEHLDLSAAPWDLQDPGVPSVSPQQALASGAIIVYKNGPGTSPKRKVSPKPGEIVILCKPLSTIDRMRQEIP